MFVLYWRDLVVRFTASSASPGRGARFQKGLHLKAFFIFSTPRSLAFDVGLQACQCRIPVFGDAVEIISSLLNRLGHVDEAILTSAASRLYEPGTLENMQVLGDRLARHTETVGQHPVGQVTETQSRTADIRFFGLQDRTVLKKRTERLSQFIELGAEPMRFK